MPIQNICTSSLGGTSRIKTLLVLVVAFCLSRSALAQSEERRLSIVDSPPSSVSGVPSSPTVKVIYTALDKITISEFEKSEPIGQLLQDLTQAWYDLAKKNGATDSEAGVMTYMKLDKKLLDMAAQTKSRLAARTISSKQAYLSQLKP
ncbi:hypothetical protein GO755_20430 [Spirosoma sp. HMF4905]|uniref:Uncharacterized protein n=1 Tax=Spirosoma arboris TaxID=2682092 RepID=A0A7K1SF38_9BACT|nr:hypothetical protein [Spirosoma arboris]MVM32425.1 hypothetical protein [Spirosoma arboris]